MNLYNLSRQVYPSDKYNPEVIVLCTLDGVDMYSYMGYHAEVELPDYKFAKKLGVRNADGKRATTLHKWENYEPVTLQSREDEMVWLSNGSILGEAVKIQAPYYDYYKARYPEGVFLHPRANAKYEPVRIEVDGKMVACIMPLRQD